MILLIPLLNLIGSLLVIPLHKLGRKVVEYFSVTVSGLAALLSIYQYLIFDGIIILGYPNSYFTFILDSLSMLLLIVVNCLGFLIVLYSVGYMGEEKDYVRYYFFILLFIGAMSGLVLAGDLILLYIFWEIVGICSAFLIAFWWKKPEARRAGLKAFTVTRIGDFAMLLGIGLIYIHFGSTYVPYVLSNVSNTWLAFPIAMLLIIAAVGKSAQFPLHVWLPDAMEGPTSVSALIHAATMVKAGVYLISRMYPLIVSSGATPVLVSIGLVTAFISGLSAIASEDIKRVLAYSTINHLSLMFIALGVMNWTFAQLHLLTHALFKALLFLVAGILIHETGTRLITDMEGILAREKLLAFTFTVGVLSLAGVPPLPGFVTKEHILDALSHLLPEDLSMFTSFILSLISSLYIFRLLFLLITGSGEKKVHGRDWFMLLPVLVLAISTLVGVLLLETISMKLFHEQVEIFHVNPIAVSGTVLGVFLAYLLWFKRLVNLLPKWIASLAMFANKGFYIDTLYTWIARWISSSGSRLITKLQCGIPSVNVMWILASLIILLTIVLLGGV